MDKRGLDRAVTYCKVFAAYNMVIIHGYSMLALPGLAALYPISPFSTLRGFFPLALPSLAGFYLRAYLEPRIYRHRVDYAVVKFSLFFVLAAFWIEAVRLLLLMISPSLMLAWQALHFVALSAVVTCLTVYLHEYLVIGLTIAVAMARWPLERFFSPLDVRFSDHSFSHWSSISWIWSGLVFLILIGPLFAIWRMTTTFRVRLVTFAAGTVVFGFVICFAQPAMLGSQQALLDFVNLPHDIFLPSTSGTNYWSFFVFFPIFISGYFFRWFAYTCRSEKMLLGLGSVLMLAAIFFVAFGLQDYTKLVDPVTLYTHALYDLDLSYTIGITSFFYFFVLACYFIFRRRRFSWLDRYASYTQDVVTLYTIHTFFFGLIFACLPAHWNDKFISLGYPTAFYFVVLLAIVHLVYFLSIFVAHKISSRLAKFLLGLKIRGVRELHAPVTFSLPHPR
jgi:hypothetical protein